MTYRILLTNNITGEKMISGKSWTVREVAEYVARTTFTSGNGNFTVEVIAEVQG